MSVIMTASDLHQKKNIDLVKLRTTTALFGIKSI